jgi:hypothetical protein
MGLASFMNSKAKRSLMPKASEVQLAFYAAKSLPPLSHIMGKVLHPLTLTPFPAIYRPQQRGIIDLIDRGA